MRHQSNSLLLATIAAAAIVLASGSTPEPSAPIHLALSDIIRCSPTTEPEPGRLERVGFRSSLLERHRAGAQIYLAEIYDPADCARADQDLAAVELAPAPRDKA